MSSLEADMRMRSGTRRAGGTAAVIETRCGYGSRTGLLAGSQACHYYFGTTTDLRCTVAVDVSYGCGVKVSVSDPP
jgi:hypothetical protein